MEQNEKYLPSYLSYLKKETRRELLHVTKYKISEHAKIRYAERIVKKEKKIDILTYAMQNQKRIESAILKMIKYGDLIYQGKQLRHRNVTEIFMNKHWVLIIDSKTKTVITLYQIDVDTTDAEAFIEEHLHAIHETKEYSVRLRKQLNQLTYKYNMMIQETMQNQSSAMAASIKKEKKKIVNEYTQKLYQLDIKQQEIVEHLIGRKDDGDSSQLLSFG